MTVTFLITFSCYGCHMHGAESGSVDRAHNIPGSPSLEPSNNRANFEAEEMDQPCYVLDPVRRDAVREAIQEVCQHRNWNLLAAHVRSTHVHAVVEAEVQPERVMNDLKIYASRRLNGMGLDGPWRKRWTRHGSTLWLWNPAQVSAAVEYVLTGQGTPMSRFDGERWLG